MNVPCEIHVGEKDIVMERVLRMMCGLEIPRWTSFDEVEASIELIEKWDTLGPLSVIRMAIASPLFADDALRVYVLTTHFGWEEETAAVLLHTLKLQLLSGEHDEILCQLSSKSLLTLISFHDRCKARFKEAMNSTELFTAGNTDSRLCSCGQLKDNSSWRILKAKLLTEFDLRPLGDHILVDMSRWPESAACWRAKCRCGTVYYNEVSTINDIKLSINKAIDPVPLPAAIM